MATSKDAVELKSKKKEITDKKDINKPRAGYGRVITSTYVGVGVNRHKVYHKTDIATKMKGKPNEVLLQYMRKVEAKKLNIAINNVEEVILPDDFQVPQEWKKSLDSMKSV
jgi:hypothetical protein